ncbi:MAG: hypothetical protein KDB98_13870, partial [Flavobacteriales bacterium]|nr:hypothetical protein [Flavobacteriales bacterium]
MRLRVVFLSLFLIGWSSLGWSQNGLPFMTNIELNRQFSDSRIRSIIQDSEESMYFSTARGVLRFDGSRWIRIATPSPALKLVHDKVSNRVFVGLKDGAVEVLRSDSGTYEVQPIKGISNGQPINQILTTEGNVFFIGESEIYRLSSLDNEPAERFEFSEMLIS